MPLEELNKVEYEGRGVNRGDADQFVDIVAVHGLNENMLDAWTDPETKVLWLRDLLPQTIRVARVLTFGYDASASSFYGSGSVDRIQQHAHTLVADLQADRSLRGCLQRPIIFICHGFGGTLVKKALAYSSTRTSKNVDHLHFIFVSTFAIMFFGTPHNGTDRANWLVWPQVHTLEGSQLLSAVETDSETLQAITEQFAPLMKQFRIFFFWEELPGRVMDKVGFVVEEHSAAPIIDNTERSGIHATHLQMIRFSTTSSPGYRTVIEALIRYCRAAPPIIAHRQGHAAAVLAHARSCEAQELTSIGIAFKVQSNDQPFYLRQGQICHQPGTEDSGGRSMGICKRSDGSKVNVLLEWRAAAPADLGARLARALENIPTDKDVNRPEELRTLKFAQDQSLPALVYECAQQPVNLRDVLQTISKPSGEERRILGGIVATKIRSLNFHFRLQHAGLRTESFVFLDSKRLDLTNPYVLDWGRPSSPGIYQHPEYQEGQNAWFYDVWSLMIVLSEIAEWKPVEHGTSWDARKKEVVSTNWRGERTARIMQYGFGFLEKDCSTLESLSMKEIKGFFDTLCSLFEGS